MWTNSTAPEIRWKKIRFGHVPANPGVEIAMPVRLHEEGGFNHSEHLENAPINQIQCIDSDDWRNIDHPEWRDEPSEYA